VIKLKF